MSKDSSIGGLPIQPTPLNSGTRVSGTVVTENTKPVDQAQREVTTATRNHADAVKVQVTNSAHNNNYALIRNLDLNNDEISKQFFHSLRLSSCFKWLPEDDNSPEFLKIKDFFQDLIDKGAFVLYDDRASVHQIRPGHMQIVLGGTLQMTHDRYSRNIDAIRDIGYNGPSFSTGRDIGSWSMAGNTGSHFGEIEAIGPALCFSIGSDDYKNLIELTMNSGNLSHPQEAINNDDVKALKNAGLFVNYDSNSNGFYAVLRQRDFNKKIKDIDDSLREEVGRIWQQYKLDQVDFIREEDGQWIPYKNEIQSSIKNSSRNQHILQKNFFHPENGSAPNIHPIFNRSFKNEEMIALSRNMQGVEGALTFKAKDLENKILLLTFVSDDVEEPQQPMRDLQGVSLGTIKITINNNGKQEETSLGIDSSGVTDLDKILHSLISEGKLSEARNIDNISLELKQSMAAYALDIDHYNRELIQSGHYSWDQVIHQMSTHGYEFSAEAKDKLIEILNEAESLLDGHKNSDTKLSFKARRDMIKLLAQWLKRDLMNKKTPDRIDFGKDELNQVGALFAFYIQQETQTLSEDFQKFLALMNTGVNWKSQVATVVESFRDRTWLNSLPEEERVKYNYKDVKHSFSFGADDVLRESVVSGVNSKQLNLDVAWSNSEVQDLLIIPDRHEDLWGLKNELKAIGVITDDEKLNIQNMQGKDLIFLGDAINRKVSNNGYGTLKFVRGLIEQARTHNVSNSSRHKQINIGMLLGNHELDLLRMSDEDIAQQFPELSQKLIARETKNMISEMVRDNMITACLYRGDRKKPEDPNSHALLSHAGILPSFKNRIFTELNENQRNDFVFVNYLNEQLKIAVKDEDYSHLMFAKSKLRGGSSDISGLFEADMGSSPKSDLSNEAGIMERETQLQVGNQIVGHSFDYDRQEPQCAETSNGTKINSLILCDTGDHQIFTNDPSELISATYISKGKIYQLKAQTQAGPPKISSEEEVYELSKGRGSPAYMAALRQYSRPQYLPFFFKGLI